MPVEGPESPLFALEVFMTAVLMFGLIVKDVVDSLCMKFHFTVDNLPNLGLSYVLWKFNLVEIMTDKSRKGKG